MGTTTHFSYRSIGNICRLLLTIQFEKSEYYEQYAMSWSTIFDTESGETIIENLLEALYPQGCKIGASEICKLLDACINYLRDSKETAVRNAVNEDIKRRCGYWVYSKYNNTVYPCSFGEHTITIGKIVSEFYGTTFSEMSDEQIEKFILSNFTIRSDNLTVGMIAKSNSIKDERYLYFNDFST